MGNENESETEHKEKRKQEKIGDIGSVKTPEDKKVETGLNLCYITLGLIGSMSVMMLVYFFIATHSLESYIDLTTADSINIYKEARNAITDDIVKIGDRFLGSVLLPILTLLMGYMFGAREKQGKEGE